uniref:Uncharacterized protein n=1 Tax=Rhizophora mucronata TaxID=61149 RepID=A0A2P2PE98_RHIMU
MRSRFPNARDTESYFSISLKNLQQNTCSKGCETELKPQILPEN